MRKLEIDLDRLGIIFFIMFLTIMVIAAVTFFMGFFLCLLFLMGVMQKMSAGIAFASIIKIYGTALLMAGVRDMVMGIMAASYGWIIYRRTLASHIKIEGK